MGKYQLPHNEGVIEVIAGEFNNVKGPASTFTPIQMYSGRIKKNASVNFTLPSNYNTGILVVEGRVTINGSGTVPADNFILFKNDGETISVQAEEDSIFLVLSGSPINEPIAAYGPFLMNTHEELEQAVNDYNHGKFGYLED